MSSLGRGLESLIPPKDDDNASDDGAKQSNPQHPYPIPASLEADDELPSAPAPQMLEPAAHIPASEPAVRREAAISKRRDPKGAGRLLESGVFQIEVDKIKSNPDQPRKYFDEAALRDLALSIREFGILQPIVVSKIERETETGSEVEYQLIAGERRLMASKLAGLERVPAIVRVVGARREQLELAIIENIQRENLSPIETARAFARLQDEFRLTQREIAARLGKSRESVANTIRLLNLPTSIQKALDEGTINESQARLLLGVANIKEQEKIFADLVTNKLSVRKLKSRIKEAEPKHKEASEWQDALGEDDPETLHAREQLEMFFNAPVKVEKSGETGKIVISFYSPEELQHIMQRLAEAKDKIEEAEDEESEPDEDSEEFIV